jgi:hypothetical protein
MILWFFIILYDMLSNLSIVSNRTLWQWLGCVGASIGLLDAIRHITRPYFWILTDVADGATRRGGIGGHNNRSAVRRRKQPDRTAA